MMGKSFELESVRLTLNIIIEGIAQHKIKNNQLFSLNKNSGAKIDAVAIDKNIPANSLFFIYLQRIVDCESTRSCKQ